VGRGIDTVSSCYECFAKLSKGQNFYLFDDFAFVTASTNCNFLGYSVKFDDEITCKENV
jgi:hypothetical protein